MLGALLLLATACLGQGDDTGTAGGGGDGGGGDGGGGTVSVLDAFTETGDQIGFEAMVAAFEEQTGHTVEPEHSSSSDDTALTRVAGGNPPDVIIHAQPGLLADFVDRGEAVPLDFLDSAQLQEDLVAGLVDLGTFDDTLYGLPIKLQLKSLTWYPVDDFESAGYEVPTSWDDMMALSQTIADTGTAPWCVGIESAEATGWVATDWIEDIMLRLHGPEVYDQWVAHELPFSSPEVTEAFEHLEQIWLTEGFVQGGAQAILSTPFGDAAAPMFQDPPGCFLHRQASFIQANFPDDAEFGTDFGFFVFPPIGGEEDAPGLIAGDTAALYTDNPAAQEFIEFMATPEAQETWAAEGSYLCTLRACDAEVYPNEAFGQQDDIVSNAPFVRFDASDLMPAQVGAGAFWSETVSWLAGEQDLETTLSNIDAAWPQGEESAGSTPTETSS